MNKESHLIFQYCEKIVTFGVSLTQYFYNCAFYIEKMPPKVSPKHLTVSKKRLSKSRLRNAMKKKKAMHESNERIENSTEQISSTMEMEQIMENSKQESSMEMEDYEFVTMENNLDENRMEIEDGGFDTIENNVRENIVEMEGNVTSVEADSMPPERDLINEGSISVGRRLVDIDYFLEQVQQSKNQHLCGCGFEDLAVTKTSGNGLTSKLHLVCKMCQITVKYSTIKPEANLNKELVAGALSTGIGFSQTKELLTILDVPTMSNKTFIKNEHIVGTDIGDRLKESMLEAGREEYELAKEGNDIDDDGIAFIKVICDASWAKRSYGTNYNSNSGVACIIGQRTNKILFLGIRNRNCYACTRYGDQVNANHKCSKNWDKASTSMEADIILEGFKRSMSDHRLRYAYLIGDGDSSVHNTLVTSRPYGNKIVKKIECVNHLYRNLSKNMRAISIRKQSVYVPPLLKRAIVNNAEKMVKTIQFEAAGLAEDASLRNASEKLRKILHIVPSHIFGDHSACANVSARFTCNNAECNYVNDMKTCGLFADIMAYFQLRIICNAESLIIRSNNNAAERYNSLVAKFIGGKRIDFTKRVSYTYRCQAAALSYNTKDEYYKKIAYEVLSKPPSKLLNKYSADRKKAMGVSRIHKRRVIINPRHECNDDYGPTASLNFTNEEIEQEKKEILNNLIKTPAELHAIERETEDQVVSTKWMEERLERITASLFGRICKMRASTSPLKLINELLYRHVHLPRATKAMTHGIIHEKSAKNKFEEVTGLKVVKCGLFIQEDMGYLGASPDGLIGDDAIIEIKCPYTAREYEPLRAARLNKINYVMIDNNDNLKLKRNHNYYYQVQGQLLITKRKLCYFVIWTPKQISIEEIHMDNNFCNAMTEKLKTFYMGKFLPELAKKHLKDKASNVLQ